MAIEEITGNAWEDTGVYCMARVTGNDAANITQASLTSVKYEVWAVDPEPEPPGFAPAGTPQKKFGSTTLTIADVVFDTPQTTALDARWTKDLIGYNFAFEVPAAELPGAALGSWPKPQAYRIDVEFDAVSGENFRIAFRVSAKQHLYGKS